MSRSVLVVFLCVGCASLPFSAGASWNYEDPAKWKGICASGEKQSPINITGAIQDKALGEFSLKNYDVKMSQANFTAKNNGHGFVVSFPEKFFNVSKGGLIGTYTTVQFHLHWGENNGKGSEHTVDKKEYAAEFHFVSYNTKYPDIGTALGKSDGLAVLGVLIEVGGEDNKAYSFLDVIRYANITTPTEQGISISPFKFDGILPTNLTKFFRYQGSLTTPTCNEAVTWTVFKQAVNISERQIGLLRSLKEENGTAMVDNFRPPQPLHGRTIYANVKQPPSSATEIKITAVLLLSMLLASFFIR